MDEPVETTSAAAQPAPGEVAALSWGRWHAGAMWGRWGGCYTMTNCVSANRRVQPENRPSCGVTIQWRRCKSAANDTLPGASRPHARKPSMAEPLQLPLFPDRAALIRVRPDRGEARFYGLEVWPDLFGRALLVRHWGRIGTKGRRRLDPHPDPGAAINALARLARARRRCGYRDRDV